MINRGNHHVLYDDVELMKLIRDPQTLAVLKQLQQYYEARCIRKSYDGMETIASKSVEGIKQLERDEFLKLVEETRIWLKVPKDDGMPIKKRKLRKVRA